MDNKALYNLEYGVFMLATRFEEKMNGCITNTCIQVASNPTRLAIACINSNYTCDLIKQSGVFTLSILDKNVSYATIERFGMQSGRDVDKFEGLDKGMDSRWVPYLKTEANAYISCNVVSSQDLGSHTLFIGEVVDAAVLSREPSLTYNYYHANIKPKPQAPAAEKPVKAWKCKICGYVYEGSVLPADYLCPVCGHPAEDFEPVYE